MGEVDRATTDLLDRYLDGLVGRGSPPRDGLDPTLTATARYLHILGAAPAPRAASDRVWQRVATVPGTECASGRQRRPFAGLRPRGVWRPVGSAATVAMLVLTLMAGYASVRVDAPGVVDQQSPPFELFVSEDENRQRFVQLDPETLTDVEGGVALEAATPSYGWWTVSGDGSTVVAVEQRLDVVTSVTVEAWTVVVRDGRTGAERTRFALATHAAYPVRLTRDGSRLVMVTESMPGKPPTWQTYDTATGNLRTSVQGGDDWSGAAIDPERQRLYYLDAPLKGSAPDALLGPQSLALVAVDLTTGAEVGRMPTPDVRGGTWRTDHALVDGLPITATLHPALAISPDGRRLAIVHADEDVVTLVSADRLVIERAMALRRESSWRERLVALLPLVPQEAEAKQATESTYLSADFGPDGRFLYITGSGYDHTADHHWERWTLGLRLVDLERGTIAAELSPDIWGDYAEAPGVSLAPDGRSVYITVPKDPERRRPDAPYLLRRLDATTLETLAEREIRVWTAVLVKPAAQ